MDAEDKSKPEKKKQTKAKKNTLVFIIFYNNIKIGGLNICLAEYIYLFADRSM